MKPLITGFLFLLALPCWGLSSSTNYQLGYAATDGGGGSGNSISYTLQASEIGKSLQTGIGVSSQYQVALGTPVHDDDGDGLDSGAEQLVFNTDANNADTDDDLLNDGQEVMATLTDPNLFDTDGDTIGDGEEVANGWNPLDELDPFGALENVPLPLWALIFLSCGLVLIQQRLSRFTT